MRKRKTTRSVRLQLDFVLELDHELDGVPFAGVHECGNKMLHGAAMAAIALLPEHHERCEVLMRNVGVSMGLDYRKKPEPEGGT